MKLKSTLRLKNSNLPIVLTFFEYVLHDGFELTGTDLHVLAGGKEKKMSDMLAQTRDYPLPRHFLETHPARLRVYSLHRRSFGKWLWTVFPPQSPLQFGVFFAKGRNEISPQINAITTQIVKKSTLHLCIRVKSIFRQRDADSQSESSSINRSDYGGLPAGVFLNSSSMLYI